MKAAGLRHRLEKQQQEEEQLKARECDLQARLDASESSDVALSEPGHLFLKRFLY